MYLIYEDEKGIKVAREDGRLDKYTNYYGNQTQAILYLGDLDYKVIENDWMQNV